MVSKQNLTMEYKGALGLVCMYMRSVFGAPRSSCKARSGVCETFAARSMVHAAGCTLVLDIARSSCHLVHDGMLGVILEPASS